MSKIEFLKEQMIEARAFVNRLMSELPEDLWYGFKFHLAGGTFIGFAEFSYYDCCDRSK